ncbi:MAG TPA: amidohydrolase family protein [Vicinamibacterales bacterium]|nr:amidohydrolase family protein [Vicinamibacterales bacterium]
MTTILLRSFRFVALCFAAGVTVLAQQPYDLVIAGGRIIDPESGVDAIRHIGIRGDRIAQISTTPLTGRDTIDAAGLVVAPGFIDLHRHGVGNTSYEYAARDGVTSAFELEIGTADVDAWYRMLGPSRLINFGVGAGHIGARMEVLGDKGFLLPTGPGRGAATPEQVSRIAAIVERALAAGGIAAGIGTSYTPGAGEAELAAIVEAASRHGAMVFAHLGSLKAAIATAAKFRTPLHVAHVNSTAGDRIREWLEMIAEARRQGVDVTTELYPYTAGASLIQSALYDGWEKRPDEWFATLQWAATGERLTRETFARYRKQGGSVISHSNTEENVRISIADPLPMIASDGGRDLDDRPTHPRASGTFARILGEYVREQKILTLHDALRRMTIEPARRLQDRVPDMRDRGRLRVDAYADITVFDPATVKDQSTYVDAAQYSRGISHVIVNGTPVVRAGDFATHAVLQGQRLVLGSSMPGRPMRATREQ